LEGSLTLGLDHVSYLVVLALLILFGTSLTAWLHPFPALKAARRWKFYDQPRQFEKLALSAERYWFAEFSDSTVAAPALSCFRQRRCTYRKGIVGRIGPIVVHVGIVLILAGEFGSHDRLFWVKKWFLVSFQVKKHRGSWTIGRRADSQRLVNACQSLLD